MAGFAKSSLLLFCSVFALAAMQPARGDITVGVIVSATGGAASQGIPEKKLIEMLPATLGGEPSRYVILDDATDPALAARNARKLTSEEHVDVLIAASNTPSAVVIAGIAQESKTPHVSMAPVVPTEVQFPWVFVVPQPTGLMVDAILEDMKKNGVKNVGYIGYSDSWGDLVYKHLTTRADEYGIKVLNNERFARTDSSAVAQILKSMALKPDAMLIGATGTPATLPHLTLVDRGYKGKIYHTHGVVNNDFLRVGGKGVEGALAPIGPVVVHKDLDDSNPIKKLSADFIAQYSSSYGGGPVNAFATWAYDAYLLVDKAAGVALKSAKPGTEEFRLALRDALERDTAGLVGLNGIYDIDASNHNGLDERARVMVEVQDSQWRLLK
ncbi:ABC transporter substrate-binding protein [Pusillimonas noertemannii]|uniref:Branched-chain amino acid transport system substrate-binding protein n=1 Tax=Pusillimonas noertemannii TaxID=305977 RepID=A0A2U1CPV6_9BURK|nr:ABC transporter substrate-binding protein [Pusillimonas noertemannii]NYT67245.1 ABC transporter substrate-binding protein [Pusillimonas noertemannii]PVY67918.1 branched-chain amino acid transport system substrate-binding protein [Pusillimonas noertemannii]